jgi:hypothetical protein
MRMSNLSLRSALQEDKFNLKVIITVMALVDLFFFPFIMDHGLYKEFFYLIVYEVSIVLSFLFGLRGQGKYKAMMISLQSIARNKDMDINERDTRLVAMIHHACLELGYIYEERNEELGLDFTKKRSYKKKKKEREGNKIKIRGVIKLEDPTLRLLGWLVLDVMAAVIAFISEFLVVGTNFSPIQIAAMIAVMVGVWAVVEEMLRKYFKLPPKKSEPEPEPQPLPPQAREPGVTYTSTS